MHDLIFWRIRTCVAAFCGKHNTARGQPFGGVNTSVHTYTYTQSLRTQSVIFRRFKGGSQRALILPGPSLRAWQRMRHTRFSNF